MYLMISYDIKIDKRRQKIHNLLKDYGRWVQYSVFECEISEKAHRALRRRLDSLIKKDQEDNIRFYQLCRDCQQQIEQLGVPAPDSNPSLIL